MRNDQQIEPLLINPATAARMLGIGRSFFYSQVACGRIGPQPLCFGANKKLYSVMELRSWIQAGAPSREEWQQTKEKS